MNETFHLGDILSVTTGRLVSLDRMGGIYRIVDYMTGVEHYTHQLSRGADACKAYLIEQYPWLSEVQPPGKFTDPQHVETWVAAMVERYGERHEVAPISTGEYNS